MAVVHRAMKTNILASALALSDRDLLARIDALARTEREATAELVAHLRALELRPSLYLVQGYGSLFGFPVILDHLASGALTLTSVRLVGRLLTVENHEAVLARAKDKALREIQNIGEAPRAGVPSDTAACTQEPRPGPNQDGLGSRKGPSRH